MALTIQSLFFAAYTVLGFGLALVSAGLALTNLRLMGQKQAFLVLVTGGITFPVFVVAAQGSMSGFGFLLPMNALLPPLCIAAAVANFVSVRPQGLATRALMLTTCVWNVVLALVYVVRCLHVVFHVEIGALGNGLLTAFALTQRNVGWEAAETLPVFLFVPILLPPFAFSGKVPLTTIGAGAFLSTFMAALLGISVPGGFEVAKSKLAQATHKGIPPRSDIRVSMRVGDARWRRAVDKPPLLAVLGNTPDWQTRIERAKTLGLTGLDLPVAADAVKDDARYQRLDHVAKRVRAAGLQLNLVVTPPKPQGTLLHHTKYLAVMQEAHWILAERLEPDLLVVFARPFHEDTVQVVGELKVAKWAELVHTAIRALRQGQPGQKTAIELEPPLERAKELFVEVTKSDAGPDEVRFIVDANRAEGPTTLRTLLELGGWIASHPTHTRIGLVGSPPSPLGLGGFGPQSSYLRSLIGFAANQPMVRSVCVGPMLDTKTGLNGYWDNRDKGRPCVAELSHLLREVRGAAAPSAR